MVGSGPRPGTVLGRQQPLAGRVELWLETATQEQRQSLRSTREPSMPPTFADLGVPARLCERLDVLGITEPFPVQAATLPDALAGRDVCGKAPTGSGKTIAFGLPMLARIEKAAPRRPKGLVLVPTRELASQVQEQLQALCWGTKTEVLAVYGGAGMERQMRALGKGVEIVVATPGRLKDLLDRGSLRLDDVNLVVIDEADRMADMGFLPEVRRLLDQTNPKRQTMLFSATLDGDVDVLIRNYQTNPVHHEAHVDRGAGRGHPPLLVRVPRRPHRRWPPPSSSGRGRRSCSAAPGTVPSACRSSCARPASAPRPSTATAARASASGRWRSSGAATCTCSSPPTWRLVASTSTTSPACCSSTRRPPTRTTSTAPGRTGRAGEAGTVITFVPPEKEKDVRKMQRELRRREPIEAATVATAASVLASTPPKPIDRGDGLDGVSRRERARANVDRVADLGSPGANRPPQASHRKGASPRQVAEGDWTPRAKPGKPAASKGRNGQERAGAPARSGRPGAKPGRRPAGAGAARPGRPAGGNGRRRSR